MTNPKTVDYSSEVGVDLTSRLGSLHAGHTTAVGELRSSMAAADAPSAARTYLRRFDAQALASAEAIDRLHAAGAPLPRLAGLAVSIKDLFDVAGHPTTAGSLVLQDTAAAATDSPLVARLRRAGAALTGHTNMTEFAYSGLGLNPHHGTPANPVTPSIDGQVRIPGGSSSGAAVSVAVGAAWAALGSDTGGSIRIPAAFTGLVGYKNTARLTPAAGMLPLSTSLDTACAVTRSVRDAIAVHEILADREVRLRRRPLTDFHLAVATEWFLDDMDDPVARAFEDSLATLRRAGARIDEIPLAEVNDLRALHSVGTLTGAQSWAWHRRRLAADGGRYDPRVSSRIVKGAPLTAADYLDLVAARQRWIRRVEQALQPYDAVLSPTVPIVAPLMQPLIDSDDHYALTNALVLRNPAVVNMLDGCAISLPCHRPGTLPVGLMAWSTALRDDTLLDLALAIEAHLVSPHGAVRAPA